MSRIHILPQILADKIAAGEVVERPASVVKELVENALDAGAKHIRVDIRGAGRELIQVTDDGCGMTLEETKLSIQRHATSKIKEESDLFCIATLGFRGEALPSITAVSQLTLESKPQGVLEGSHVSVRGGELVEARAAGCPVGTKIAVSELFYNTPARLKFLKSDGVELGHISDTLIRLALSRWRDCGFDLYVDGVQKLSSVLTKDPLPRLKECLGKSFLEDLVFVREENPEIKLSGWISHPRQTSGSANAIYFYLNGRFLKDRVLQHALTAGFSDFLMKGRYPKAVLYLEMNPEEVDVNVHPTKREVRFVRPQAVHQFIERAVRKVVQKQIYASADSPASPFEEFSKFVIPAKAGIQPVLTVTGSPIKAFGDDKLTLEFSKNRIQQAVGRFYGFKQVATPLFSKSSFSDFRVLGSFANTYILCESADHKLVLVDQHAAHEKIGFEKLKRDVAARGTSSQRLLMPLTWEANPKQAAVLNLHLKELQNVGLEIEPFGGETFVVKEIPTLLADISIPDLLAKITEELETFEISVAVKTATELILKTIACHAQIRAKDKLSPEEMRHLLVEMDQYNASHCPHGRPTTVEISLTQIEHWFKRI
ncbi:MAG: DNA mismatch repair endonuclease MutL [Deltaproteobacteria bacterium]|nr:DNA mismatch repair endonuclease MutL [Deltaproteobacteria bacterium]